MSQQFRFNFADDFPSDPRAGLTHMAGVVLGAFESFGLVGATDEQVQNVLRIKSQSETPRRLELVECGLIAWTGKWAETASGRLAKIWRVQGGGR